MKDPVLALLLAVFVLVFLVLAIVARPARADDAPTCGADTAVVAPDMPENGIGDSPPVP